MTNKRSKSLKKTKKGQKDPSSLPIVHKSKNKEVFDPNNPLGLYLREIQRYPLLKPEEEKELALRAFDQKDPAAAKRLIQSNLRFVVKIAFEFSKFGPKILDLIQEGNMGLIKAVQQFNPYKDVRLTTYAVWWIKSYMRDYLLKNWSVVRIGTTANQKKLFYRLKKEQQKFEQQGLKAEPKQIALNLGVKESEVKMMQQRLSGKDSSFNTAALDKDDGNFSFEQRLSDQSPLASETLAEKEQGTLFKKALEEFVNELNDREKHIFEIRLMSESPTTLKEIGSMYNVSKERARQLEENIKKKLKKFLEEHYPDISLDQ